MIQIGASPAPLDRPLEHLMACHRRIEQRLDTLVKAAGLLKADPRQALEAIAKSIQFLDSDGVLHTRDEEESVFPRLRPKLSLEEAVFVDSLEAQHHQAESIFSELKALAGRIGSPEGPSMHLESEYFERAVRLRSLYQDHIRSEDEIFSALAKRSLAGSELAQISSEMRARRSPSS